jgi:hypothetical protein
MADQLGINHDLPARFSKQTILVATEPEPKAPSQTAPPATPALSAMGHRPWASTRTVRQVAVVEVGGPLGEVVQELDQAIELALAEGPRGVVADLTNVLTDTDCVGVEKLAAVGRHVREWPAVPITVACPDRRLRQALGARPLCCHLVLTTSLLSAVSAVLATPSLPVARLQIIEHPSAPRAVRQFVTRTLLDWRLGRVIPFASLVVSELVASSTVHTGAVMDLSVGWSPGALRLMVQSRPACVPPARVDLHGRRRTVVEGLSRTFGVLPAGDGGKAVWAVLDAPAHVHLSKTAQSAPVKPQRS